MRLIKFLLIGFCFLPIITSALGRGVPLPTYDQLGYDDQQRVLWLINYFHSRSIDAGLFATQATSDAITLLVSAESHMPLVFGFADGRNRAEVSGNSIFINGVDITGNSGTHITNNNTSGNDSPIVTGSENVLSYSASPKIPTQPGNSILEKLIIPLIVVVLGGIILENYRRSKVKDHQD